ncbi:MAG TPA: C1 family peptidase [Candidatus Thermoplasmatota archaeon]|nr:C1 family peptidase [Candidatus Thermoplasmatota archaeon]
MYIVRKKFVIYFLVGVMLFFSFFIYSAASTVLTDSQVNVSSNTELPEKWDWRDVEGDDWCTPIRDQIQDECGSCWAFGTLGALESTYKIWMNDASLDVDLSEQYILSCSDGSCDGWYLPMTLDWIESQGIIFENCMPYESDDTIPCESKCDGWRDQLFGTTDYTRLPPGDIPSIKEAIVTYGPLPASMDIYADFYPTWEGGVYEYNYGDFVFGHVVTIVGYDDTEGDKDRGYWICKNSWGSDWGENGWFRIKFGECKIENSVYYLEGPNHPPGKPETPRGTNHGKAGEAYTFSSVGTDPDGDRIFYQFDWGDGDQSAWKGPVQSGERVEANYTWDEDGTYSVTVKTMDLIGPNTYDFGMQSEYSDSLEVAMPHSQGSNPLRLLYEYLLERFSFLPNH